MKIITKNNLILKIFLIAVLAFSGNSSFAAYTYQPAVASSSSAPTIVSATPSGITTTTATLNGSVNPNGANTDAWYETSLTGAQKLQFAHLGNGTSTVPLLSYTLSGLIPNTSYTFRVVAQNVNGTSYGNWIPFRTTNGGPISLKPSIIFATATPSNTSAVFDGTVNPNGTNTTAWYESSQTGNQKLEFTNIGNSTSGVPIPSYTLNGLTPNTSYTFRVVAQNVNGITNGNWITFTTTGIIPPPTSAPTIISIIPGSGIQGQNNINVTLTGTDFISGSTVVFSGTGITINSTNINSTTNITIDISIDANASVGTRNVRVVNTNGISNTKVFTVISSGPSSTPTLTSISPASGTLGQTLNVDLFGANYSSNSTYPIKTDFGPDIIVNSTTLISSTQVASNITIPSTANLGTHNVVVVSGGQTTSPQVFTVINNSSPIPTLISISPSNGTQGQNNITAVLSGNGFVPGSVVNFSNSGITINSTTINSQTTITLDISISNSAQIGTNYVSVSNTNGVSNTVSFRVIGFNTCIVPTISSISPSWIYVGNSSATVTVYGSNFSSGTTGQYNGTARTTNFVNAGQLDIVLTSSDLSSIGTGNITVTNGSNYCTSNIMTFSVNSNNGGGGGGGLVPSISSISPSSVVVGSGAITINIYGSNFSSSSSAYINGGARQTNFVNSSQLVMNLYYSDTSVVGTWNIYVNSGSGNNSNSMIFNVYSNNFGGGGNGGGGNGGGNNGGGGGGRPIYYVSVITQNASNISKNSAILNGSINPNNNMTTAWFEYGTSYNLGTYSDTTHNYFGTAGSYSVLSQSIGNLSPNTTYYFRAVANNYAGTIRGSIFSFTTGVNVINNIVSGNNTITKIIYQDTNTDTNNSYSTDTSSFDSSAGNQASINNDYFNGKDLSANASFGSINILPKTFIGWLIFLILVFIIIIISRKLYGDYSYQKTRNKVSANHINNLPV